MIARPSVAEHVVSATTAGSTRGFSKLDLSIHDRSTIVGRRRGPITTNLFFGGKRSPQFGQSRTIVAAHRALSRKPHTRSSCERSEAIHRATTHEAGLLRYALNDGGDRVGVAPNHGALVGHSDRHAASLSSISLFMTAPRSTIPSFCSAQFAEPNQRDLGCPAPFQKMISFSLNPNHFITTP